MRKLILIAMIATMSSSSCYANLSLASNDPAPASAEQHNAPEAATTKPIAAVKSPSTHKRYLRAAAYPVHRVYSYSHGGCL